MKEYIDIITRLNSEGLLDTEIAEYINIPSKKVNRWRNKLGLPKNSKLKSTKKCKQCDNIYPIENFHWVSKKRNNKSAYCRSCDSNKSKIKNKQYAESHSSEFYNNIDLTKITKNCSCCKQLKNLEKFSKYKYSATGFSSSCIECITYYQNRKGVILSRAKQSAKYKNLEFNLTKNDIYLPINCPILNVPLNYSKGDIMYAPSLDRIDNSKGYIKGNIIIMSRLANIMKNKASFDELKQFVVNITTLINYYEIEGALGDITDVFPNSKELNLDL